MNMINSKNSFRVLDDRETAMVAGGTYTEGDDVIAYGPRLHNSDRLNDYLWFFGSGSSGGSGGIGANYGNFSSGGGSGQSQAYPDPDLDNDGVPDEFDAAPDDATIGEIVVQGQPLDPRAVDYADSQYRTDIILGIIGGYFVAEGIAAFGLAYGIPNYYIYGTEIAASAITGHYGNEFSSTLWTCYYNQAIFALKNGNNLEYQDYLSATYGIDDGID